MDAPASTRAIVKRGFHWERITNPPALATPKLTAGAPLLGEEVSKLLQKGAIYKVPLQPCFLANLFSVPKASGESRPIIDLSRLNKFVKAPHFTTTNHNTLRKLISEAVWGASLDLQDAYLHVPIRKNLHKFMAFCHGHQLYFFKVLPFGLNVAPMIFLKILKHPLSRLHQEGIPVLAYLDDWITWAPNKVILQINLRKILSLLKNLGFLINYKKSQLTPASDITWLGVRWFLQEGLWDVPPSFKEKIFLEANQLLHARVVSRRSWESFTGKLAFLGQIHSHLRPNISLLSHPQYLAPAKLRDKKVLLPEVLKGSLRTWSSPSMLPGPTPFLQPRLKIALWTDASLSGWGAHSEKGHYCQGLWSNQEETLHINTLEVLAVIRAIESLNLHDLHISLHIDNEVAKFVINKLRSKAAALYPYLTMLCLLLKSRNLVITAFRIPSSLNLIADALSRDHPLTTEWSLPMDVFNKIIAWRGEVEVDLMATVLNRRVETFVSPLPHPAAAAAIDVKTVDWNTWRQVYIFPPKKFITHLLPKLQSYKFHGVFIAPWQPSAPWFPALRAEGHLHLRVQLEQSVRSERVLSGFQSYERWTAFNF